MSPVFKIASELRMKPKEINLPCTKLPHTKYEKIHANKKLTGLSKLLECIFPCAF